MSEQDLGREVLSGETPSTTEDGFMAVERDYTAEMKKIWEVPELYDAAIIRQHIGWLKIFVAQMTPENWRDMQLRMERQLDQLSDATKRL